MTNLLRMAELLVLFIPYIVTDITVQRLCRTPDFAAQNAWRNKAVNRIALFL